MDTTIKRHEHAAAQRSSFSVQPAFWKKLEDNRFGIIPLLLVFLVCLGGISIAYGTEDNTFQLGLVTFPTIITLALILAVAPMKNIAYLSILALVADLVVFML